MVNDYAYSDRQQLINSMRPWWVRVRVTHNSTSLILPGMRPWWVRVREFLTERCEP